jgi:hypothetical protein
MADTETTTKSWWGTMPGVLTALAGIITAVGGLVAVLSQNGLIGAKSTGAGAGPAASSTPGASVATPATPPAAQPAAGPAPVSTATTPPTVVSAGPGTIAHSPAEVLSGLKARGFVGVAVTHKDGSTAALAPGAELGSHEAVELTNGQRVMFDRITSIEIEQPWDGSVKINLVNGQQLVTKATNYGFSGKNELGPYNVLLENLKRIDFVRGPDKP